MQPEQPEPQPEPTPEATRVVSGAAPTAPVQETQPDGTRAFDLTGRQKPAQAQPAEEPTRIMGYTAPAAPVEEPTRIVGYTAPSAPVEEVRPDGTRAFDLSGQQRGAAAQPVEEEAGSTRVLGGSRSVVEETSIDDTQAAPLHWRTHADEPFEPRSRRAAELVEEDEYDDEPEDARGRGHHPLGSASHSPDLRGDCAERFCLLSIFPVRRRLALVLGRRRGMHHAGGAAALPPHCLCSHRIKINEEEGHAGRIFTGGV